MRLDCQRETWVELLDQFKCCRAVISEDLNADRLSERPPRPGPDSTHVFAGVELVGVNARSLRARVRAREEIKAGPRGFPREQDSRRSIGWRGGCPLACKFRSSVSN